MRSSEFPSPPPPGSSTDNLGSFWIEPLNPGDFLPTCTDPQFDSAFTKYKSPTAAGCSGSTPYRRYSYECRKHIDIHGFFYYEKGPETDVGCVSLWESPNPECPAGSCVPEL